MSLEFSSSDLRFLLDAVERISAITSINGFNAKLIPVFERGFRADRIAGTLHFNGEIVDSASSVWIQGAIVPGGVLVRKLEELSASSAGNEAIGSGVPWEALQGLGLSPREAEVLWWAAEGKANKEIAMILGVSFRTVQKHIENILRKLEVENRYASVVHALRWLGRS